MPSVQDDVSKSRRLAYRTLWKIRYGSLLSESVSGKIFKLKNHSPPSVVEKALGTHAWRSFRKVSIVRDPFDSAVSAFFWSLRGQAPRRLAEYRNEFELFIEGLVTHKVNEEVWETAASFWKILRYEYLWADLQEVVSQLGIDMTLTPLPHAKSQFRPEWSKDLTVLYSPRTLDLVARKYSTLLDLGLYTANIDG